MEGQLVGDFTVNGRQAFCLEHSKTTPSNGTGLTTDIYYNENVRKALYYGWGGVETWTGFESREQGIVVTSLALSHFYSGDHIRTIAQDFIDFLNTKSVPNYKVRFSKNSVSAYKEGNIQRTETIELVSGMTSGSVNIDLQNEVTYVNETNGYRQTGGNVTIYGQTRFHLEAPTTVALGSWTTGNKSQGFAYQPIVGVTENSKIQNIGYLDMVYDPSETTSLTVKWLELGGFRLHKTDGRGMNVEGASIKLSYNADMSSPIGTYQTKTDGTVLVENIRTGTIYYQEVGTPNHLNLDSTIKSANIEAGNITDVQLTNDWKQGYIEVAKKDSKTGKVIKQEGIEFEILKGSQVIQTIKTTSQGIAKSNILDYGDYIIREKKNPQKYVITTATKNVQVIENGGTHKVDMPNEPVVGQINLSKNDKETGKTAQGNARLNGAKYVLKANENILDPSDGSILYNKDQIISRKTVGTGNWGDTGEKIVDSNYNITWDNLPMGSYRIEEVEAPVGYLLDNNHIVTITATSATKVVEIKEVDSQEQVKKGYIQVVKKDKETGKTVKQSGIEFEILFNGKVIATIKTNANGIAKSELLPYGRYVVREKKSPNKYTITDVTQEINVYENNKVYEINISNERVRGQVNLSKTDTITGKVAQGEATLEGAIYGIYARTPICDPADGSVIYNTNVKVGELITDSEANASMGNLYLGEYYLKEITPSKGYTLDTRQYNFELTYENQNIKVVTQSVPVQERIISQPFQIIKVSSDENGEAQLLAGAEFTVKSKKDIEKYGSWEEAPIAKNANAQETAILVTDDKGGAISERLPYGEYVVRETKVPDNKYKVPDFTVRIQEDSNTPQVWRVFNDTSFKAVLKIVKQDEETGKTVQISGAKFKIRNVETGEYFGYWKWNPLPHYIDSWVTTDMGTVLTDKQLKAGKYEIEEVKSPDGYLISDKPVQFEIASNVAYETLDDGNTIVITVVQKDTSVKGKVNIEKRGEVLIDFKDGEFIYEERGLANAKYEVLAKEDILDPSNDGTVIYKKGTVVDTVITNKEGKTTSKELPLGNYLVQEVQAPNGFVLNSEIKEVSLTYAGQEIAIVYDNVGFVNQRQKVDINVIKKDIDEDTKLQGAKFGIYAKEDIYNYNGEIVVNEGTLIQTVTSNEVGNAQFSVDLPLTVFEIKELEAPVGYSSSNEVIEVNANYQGQELDKIELEYEFKNKIIEVEASKKDITDDSEIEGAHIIVFEKDNEGAIFDEWISGQDGKEDDGTVKPHKIKGLEVGKTYVMREVSCPHGFAIAQDVEFVVEDTCDIQKVEMIDEIILGQLRWDKIGEIFMAVAKGNSEFGETYTPAWHEENLKGAEITIYADEEIKIGNTVYYNKDEKVEVLKSNKESVMSKKIPVGKYYYVESKVPSGYIENADKHYFEIKDNQTTELQVVSSVLKNERAKININLTKILEKQQFFEDKEAYKDVKFGIYARKDICNYMGKVAIKKGSLIDISGIDEEGHLINVPDLPNGSYYIKELSTNSQYVLDGDKEYDFKISYHGKNVSEYTVQIGSNGIIKNKLARGEIQIVKYDSLNENKKLEEVEFNISTKKDMSKVIKTIKTDERGIATINNLELGKYYIQEAKQVDGYIVNDYIYEVEVKVNGDLLTVNVYNKPTEMQFSKVNETGEEELPGATIQIIDKETGNIIEEWVSADEPHIIHYLVEGKEYIMREITAPNGYEIAEEITFTAGDGKKVTMKDMPIEEIEVPKTGDESKIYIWLTILIISILGLGLIVYRKISENEKNKSYKG